MPAGTLGFRIVGRLKREDYVDTLVPPLHDAVDAGRSVRVLYLIEPGLHMEPAAVWEDIKLEGQLGIRHRDAWERIAVVTDQDWLWKAFDLFAWMVPGEMKLFRQEELDGAKAWLAEAGA
jgi:hypothetical protein